MIRSHNMGRHLVRRDLEDVLSLILPRVAQPPGPPPADVSLTTRFVLDPIRDMLLRSANGLQGVEHTRKSMPESQPKPDQHTGFDPPVLLFRLFSPNHVRDHADERRGYPLL
jgi:hypothetical protein